MAYHGDYDTDDEHGPIEASARLGRSSGRIVAVVAVGALILGFGVFGARPQNDVAPAPAPGSPVAVAPAPTETPNVVPSMVSYPPEPFDAANGRAVQTPLGLAHSVDLPQNTGGSLFAATGAELVFTLNNRLFDDAIVATDLLGSGRPQIVAGARECNMIVALAASGTSIAYVEQAPSGPLNTYTCQGPWKPGFQIFVTDLSGGTPRPIASGAYGSPRLPGRHFQPHLALGEGVVAYNRPTGAGDGEIVDVRAVATDRLLWSASTSEPVTGLYLGGSRLAVVQGVASLTLGVADAAHPTLRTVAHPATGASLSPDGRFLVWDEGTGRSRVVLVSEQTPGAAALRENPLRDTTLPTQPVISNGPRGPIAAWLDSFPDGPDPAPHAVETKWGLIETPQTALWLSVQDDDVLWVSGNANGRPSVAFDVELGAPPASTP